MNVSKTARILKQKSLCNFQGGKSHRISLLRALTKQSFKFFILLENLVNNTRFIQINENLNLLLLVVNYIHCWY